MYMYMYLYLYYWPCMSVIPATVAVTQKPKQNKTNYAHSTVCIRSFGAKLGALSTIQEGGAHAPLAAAPHAHAAARRRRSWLFLRIPLRIPSAPYITQADEMRCAK